MKEQDLVLQDVELCKKIQLIMERLGIECDGYYVFGLELNEEGKDYWSFLFKEEKEQIIMLQGFKAGKLKFIPTYRQDKLALALPRWCRSRFLDEALDDIADSESEAHAFATTHWDKIFEVLIYGQLKATAELLILLEENGLGKESL